MSHEIKCKNCGNFSKDTEYCQHCGTLISPEKLREQERQEHQRQRKEKQQQKEPSFIEKMRLHPSVFIRGIGKVFHSVWVAFMAIGAFIAWLIAAIAA